MLGSIWPGAIHSILHGRSNLPQHPHQLYQFPTVSSLGFLLLISRGNWQIRENCCMCTRPQFLKNEMNKERSGDPAVGTVNPRNEDGTPMFTDIMKMAVSQIMQHHCYLSHKEFRQIERANCKSQKGNLPHGTRVWMGCSSSKCRMLTECIRTSFNEKL